MTRRKTRHGSWVAPVWWVLSVALFVGCVQEGVTGPPVATETTPSQLAKHYVAMDAEAALNRATLALTGLRPSVEELELVRSDPTQLEVIVTRYVDRPEFGETIKDMYAEILLLRSTRLTLPDIGLLEGETTSDIRNALAEEPLNLVREVVMNDRPFSEIVTAPWTVLEPLSAKIWDGHDYDPSTGGMQRADFIDGRPTAGVLSTGPFLMRHESNGANYHRSRAAVLSDVFLCEPFGGRDIPITGDVDLSDDNAVANALAENPQCVACHQVVDPLAQHFWPLRARLPANQVRRAHDDQNCEGNLPCYPVPMLVSIKRNGQAVVPWELLGLRAPNYWGAPTESLTELGEEMAQDPRFARCAVQQFAAYLAQTSRDDLDPDFIGRHQVAFTESGFDAKALAKAIVLDSWFLAGTKQEDAPAYTPDVPGAQSLRPEQLERFVESLTGLRLMFQVSEQNLGLIRTLRDDTVGFRAMAGGIDGDTVTRPVHSPTPVKLLVFAAYAEEAAGYVVDTDFELPSAERRLLDQVEPDDTNAAAIRTQLTTLHARIYGRLALADDAAIDQLYLLWSTVASQSNPESAWKSVLTAMLQAPDAVFY